MTADKMHCILLVAALSRTPQGKTDSIDMYLYNELAKFRYYIYIYTPACVYTCRYIFKRESNCDLKFIYFSTYNKLFFKLKK